MVPNPAALLRLVESVLIEQHDEWEAGEPRYLSEASMLQVKTINHSPNRIYEAVIFPELIAA